MADAHQHGLVNSRELNAHSCKLCSDRFTEASHKSMFFEKKNMRYFNVARVKPLPHFIFIPRFSTRPLSQPPILDTALSPILSHPHPSSKAVKIELLKPILYYQTT